MNLKAINDSCLRVLHVIPTLELGGASRGVLEIIHELTVRGNYDVLLCVVGDPPKSSMFVPSNIRVHFLCCPVHKRKLFIRRILALYALVKAFNPDLIHAHLWPAAAAIAWVNRAFNLPIIVHIRDTPPRFQQKEFRARVKRGIYKIILNQRNISFIAVSADAAQYAIDTLNIPQQKIHVVLNGIDTDLFMNVHLINNHSFKPDKFVVGAAGRFVPEKGHLFLLQAVNNLINQGYNIKLKLVGNGGMRSIYENFLISHKLNDHVEILNPLQNMAYFYGLIDAFVVSSLTEGLSRVLLEAMVCGRPVISTNCAGSAEVIEHGINGLLIDKGSSEQIENAIRSLMLDPDLRATIGSRARAKILSHHTINHVMEGIERIYFNNVKVDSVIKIP